MENGYAKAAGCPAPAELAEFITGNLSGTSFQRIAQHVERCRACEEALGSLDAQTTPFLASLQQAGRGEATPEESVPGDLLDAARSLFGEHGAPADPPIVCPRRLGKFELLEE